jgi:hypothetical protein
METKVLDHITGEIKRHIASLQTEMDVVFPKDSRVMFMYNSKQIYPSHGTIIGCHASTQKVVIKQDNSNGKHQYRRVKHVFWKNIVHVEAEKCAN